ncbi:hypothetical protein [Cupriavidus pinatubonensis]|uniref:hypothetical protein n=1 Tax=Cupriavidus pinatubonensis TaxID=248026 RepID=UPI00360CF798
MTPTATHCAHDDRIGPPYLFVPGHSSRDARTVHLSDFAVPLLRDWLARRQALPIEGDRLFSLRPNGQPITDMRFGRIVSEILEAIGTTDVDMSPRTLRNTFCRRQLLAGRSFDEGIPTWWLSPATA